MTSKVIFLDYDGPMIPARAHWLPRFEDDCGGWDQFDPCAVAMLKSVISDTGARVVIAAWKGWAGRKFNERMFVMNGLNPLDLHDDWVTPRDVYRERRDQIEFWLDAHPEVKRYAVLDDIDMTDRFGEHMVPVSYADGMLTWHRMRMVDLLGRKENDDLYDHVHR